MMPSPIVVSQLARASFVDAPINADWILEGAPVARMAKLSSSPDNEAMSCIWECTAGTFHWRFGCDETVHVIAGSVIIHTESGQYDLRTGDSAYFPAGTSATWRVETFVRKVAFLRVPPPRPVALVLRALRGLRRLVASGAGSGVIPRQS